MFPIRRPARTRISTPSLLGPQATAEEMKPIQGQMPDSIEEYRVAVALWEMGLDFDYQYIVGANRPSGARGIFKLDFFIDVNPRAVGLEVQSVRWHSAQFSPDENFRIAYIERTLKTKIYFIWEDQLADQETATENVRALLGHLS